MTLWCSRGGRGNAGFTLYELVIALAISAILVVFAIPGLRAYVVNAKLTAGTNALVASLNYARSEAIMRAVPVSVCTSDNGIYCTATPWKQGWMVFVDQGVAGLVDGADEVLTGNGGFPDDVEFTMGGPNFIQFQPSGGLVGACEPACSVQPTGPRPVWDPSSLLAALVEALPISTAQAAPKEDKTNNGQGKKDDTDDTNDANTVTNKNAKKALKKGLALEDPGPAPESGLFQACRKGAGRSISVSPIGRIVVTEITCGP